MPTDEKNSTIFSTSKSVIPYLASALLLLLSLMPWWYWRYFFLAACLTMFLCWDIKYFYDEHTLDGRNADSLNNSTHTARSQIAYFLPFYAILFGFFFNLKPLQRDFVLNVCKEAGLPIWIIILPFFLSCIGLLFMPVQISEKRESPDEQSGKPTRSQKSIYTITAITQQWVIVIVAYSALQLLAVIPKFKALC